jgi:hypothetical protein
VSNSRVTLPEVEVEVKSTSKSTATNQPASAVDVVGVGQVDLTAREERHQPKAKRVAEARRLRSDGLLLREIGVRMGVARTTVHGWLDDPDGSKLRARKDSYRGVCVVCGGQTDGSNGREAAPELCMSCRTWTEDAIVEAIRLWASERGGLPPTEMDWRRADTDHPSATTVCGRFGWNRMLLAAGFGLRCDRRPETQAWIMEQLRSGVDVDSVADAVGVTPQAILRRLHVRGLRLKDVAPA